MIWPSGGEGGRMIGPDGDPVPDGGPTGGAGGEGMLGGVVVG
jgi:hypothetical protein